MQSLEISIFKDNLHVIIKSNAQILESQLKVEIPQNKWTMISITLEQNLDKSGYSIISVYNNKKVESKEIAILFSPNNQINCIFNQHNYTPITNDLDSNLLGNFLLSEVLSNEEIELIEIIGQKSAHQFCDGNNKIIFAYEIHSNKNLYFKNLIKNDIIKIKYSEISYQKLYSFVDIILNNDNLNLIIPIFKQSDNMLINASNRPFLNNAATEILSNLFMLEDNVQLLFLKSKYTYAIAHCLQTIPKNYITYNLYLLYFNLLNNISNNKLKRQFINIILLNYDIWSKSDRVNQKDIFKHWQEYLYIRYRDIFISIRSYEWFLINIQNNRTYSICRKSLFSISFNIFIQKPSSELILFTILMMNSSSLDLVKEILDHLQSIFLNVNILNLITINYLDILNGLIYIIENINDEEIIYKIILQIVGIYKTYCKNDQDCRIESLHNLVEVLILKVEFTFSKKYLSDLISHMNNNNSIELLPILCINIIKGGSDYFLLLEPEKFNEGVDCYINNEFIIYSSLLIFKFFSNKDFYHKSICLNISIYRYHLSELINSIFIIGILRFTPLNLDQIIHDLFNELLSELSIKEVLEQEINSLVEVINIIGNFIYFGTKELQNLIFFINSDNYDANQIKFLESLFLSFISFDDDNSAYSKILINLNSLFIKLNSYIADQKSIKIPNYEIKLRIENDKWLDLDLAEKIFLFYSTNKVIQLKEFMVILTSCILKYDSKFVIFNKPNLNKSLNFNEKPFNIKMIESKKCLKYNDRFNQIFNILKAITKSFNPINLTEFQEFKEKYVNDFTNNQNKMIAKCKRKYNNALNCFKINRSAWFKLNSLEQISIIKRSDIFNNNCYYPSNVYKKYMNKILNSNHFMNENEKLKCIECKLNKIKSVKQAFIQINKDMISIYYDGVKKVVHSNEISFINYTFINELIFKLQIIVKTGEYFDLNINHMDLSKINEFFSIERIEKLKSLEFITELWKDNKISNFEYLLKLNLFSGRSFNDAKYYPIFPLIFAEYESSTFRDFSHKMNDNLNDLLVYYWLFRIDPFTSKHKESSNSSMFKSINETSATELIPEFFFLPEFLKSKIFGDVILPSWSNKSPNEFIYLHRKALESEYVFLHLNEWIDSIWGIKQNNQFIPKLFEQKHPIKSKFNPKSSSSFKYSFLEFSEISDFVCSNVTLKGSLLYFTLIDSHGEIYFYHVDILCLKDVKKLILQYDEKINSNEDLLSPKFIDSQRFCFIDKSNNAVKLFSIVNRSIEKTIEKKSKIISIETSSKNLFAISTEDTSISIYDADLIPLQRNSSKSFFFSSFQLNNQEIEYSEKIFTFSGIIDCIAINSTFHICVCGTTDNCLLLCQINKNKIKINRVIKTEKMPQKIIITDNFGFIVVLFQNKLDLYNINGEKIKSLNIDVVSMTMASSLPGKFDYLIIADKNNRISVFEAFYMKIGKSIFQCKSKVQELAYIKEESIIIAFCENSTASVIYYPIADYKT